MQNEYMTINEYRARLKTLLEEIEYIHLSRDWWERLIECGASEEDTKRWVPYLRFVVEEYKLSLDYLIELISTREAVQAAEGLQNWIAYTRDITIWKMDLVRKIIHNTYNPDTDN